MKLPSFLKGKGLVRAKRVFVDQKEATAPAEPKKPAIDFAKIAEDFKTLDPKDPGLWATAPKVVILLGLFSVLVGAAYWLGWNVQFEELTQKESEETKLKDDWLDRKRQAVNLDEHRRQLAEINTGFGELLKQLPNQSEIGDLLVDINKAAQTRGLLVDLFKPGGEATKEFYAEVPITLQLTGNYHDVGAFAGDVAQLPRIVTLNDIDLVGNAKDGSLVMKTTAKTFRYLDEDEMAKRRKTAAPAAKAKQ
ncbi:MAG: type 4a pilus biogenesis protein PilO [Rhodocyclaceae bacterium]|nr:type 4a pilus biogenesis protein PilO [Rhodocyclaceae bacterium]